MKYNILLHDHVDVDKFAEDLSSIGVRVAQKLPFLKLLTAEVPDTHLHAVTSMDGVRAVEPNQEIHEASIS